jgi:kynureninase
VSNAGAAPVFPREAGLERWALEQDTLDPLAWCRAAFELPVDGDGAPLVYLCGNSLGLMPREARTVVARELEAWSRRGVEGHLEGTNPWYSYHEPLVPPMARLVGALPGEVALMNSLTVNLHLMMISFYRPTPGRWKILMEESAFPSDLYAVESHLRSRGLDPDDGMIVARPRTGEVHLRTEDLEDLLAARGGEIALVVLPGVQYFSGQLLDMERLSRAAHAAGSVVGFDLAHAAGNATLRLHDWNVDFAVWCSYKYLNAGPGAVAGCFVHERHGSDLTVPRLAGWWGNDPATRFRMHLNDRFVPVAGAAGWQVSNPPILAMASLGPSLALFDRAGMPALREKSRRLTGYLAQLLSDLPADRIRLLTPRDPGARGCQLSYQVPTGARALSDELRRRKIVGDFRAPDVIRLSPVPLYNTFHEVWRAADAMRELVSAA